MKKMVLAAIVIVLAGGVFWYLNIANTMITSKEALQSGIVKLETKGNEASNSGSNLMPPSFPN